MIDVQFNLSSPIEEGQMTAVLFILSANGFMNGVTSPATKEDFHIVLEHPIFFFIGRCIGIIQQFSFQSLIEDSKLSSSTSPLFITVDHLNSHNNNTNNVKNYTEESDEELSVGLKEEEKSSFPSIHIENADLFEIRDPQFESILERIRIGLNQYEPELCSEGVNGSYFLKDSNGKIIAIFKPEDEEGSSQNNPKEKEVSQDNRGILPGEAATREVAAFVLDSENGNRFGVPSTHMVRLSHPLFGNDSTGNPKIKTGSLQMFAENDGASWDVGSNVFPVEEVHKIAILDLILFNTDRHEGNILFKKSSNGYELIPIDHGFSLPDHLGSAWFDWMNYSQSKKPFSAESLEFIESFDLEKNSELLSKHLAVRNECLKVMKISVTLLKRGAALGLTPFQIGKFASRRNLKEPSQLENVVARCSNAYDEPSFLFELSEKLDRELLKISPC